MDNIPQHFAMPSDGAQETVDELPSAVDYYDGSRNLNVIKVDCSINTNSPIACLQQPVCGWCGSTSSCIRGNNLGPLVGCQRSTYVFTAPYPNWNPNAKVVNEQLNGVSLTLVNK